MSTEKATQAIPCSTPGSPNTAEGATSLQELRSQIAAQAGRLILVSEKKHSNGYSVYYQPAASSENICQKYYEEVLQRWQQRYKKGDRPGVEKKLRDAEARRATIRQDTLERLAKHMLRIQQALGKRQELFNSKCTQTQKASNNALARVLEALHRRAKRQQELKNKFMELYKRSARNREEVKRRAAELQRRIEAREKQAHALRCEQLQKKRKKGSAAAVADKTNNASSSVTTEA
ncbi:hypothetical protein, conserved [Eimeria necatrix]|uniref:Uncharacterized protein n=1 Tax=Eimeria necatrix TaxID=51315 RepID=U6MDP7_9EIME|nr:hypothetical protein, conserved [Eimeria necatrix]CDJ62131.1 hypothetical protein, conserved [Eimeria necatrix]